MTRIQNWQTRLSDYLTHCYITPFQYGELDCGLFIAGAIEAMTGVDVAESLRDKYTNRREAFAAIKAMCGIATMEAIAVHLAAQYEAKEIPVPFAQRGDAVVLKKGRASTLGIIAMHGTEVLTPYKDGILRVPLHLAQVSRAFHI
jgi:hypothetical protein